MEEIDPKSEHECFTENRTLDNLWHQLFPADGTESVAMVANFVWNFSNLESAFEQGGELHDKKVFLFGTTEPQLMLVQGEEKVTTIPVVIAVVSPFPPSDKIGIVSLMNNSEQIVPMEQMKMDWIPYRLSQDESLGNSQVFVLSCSEMRDALGHLKIERIKEFKHWLPCK